jgi:ATP-binding protein involved in chromosome partitioning
MAQKTGMRLVGVVENMSSDVFGTGGGERLAGQLRVPLLGRVPLDARVRASADLGTPLVLSDPDCEPAVELARIAEVIDASRAGGFTRTLPLVS